MVSPRRPAGKRAGVPEPRHLLSGGDGGSEGFTQGCGTLPTGGGGREVGKISPPWYPENGGLILDAVIRLVGRFVLLPSLEQWIVARTTADL